MFNVNINIEMHIGKNVKRQLHHRFTCHHCSSSPPVCVCVCASHGFASAPSIYLLNVTDRHMRDRLNHNTHIIYEHMFCSCWSFAITLTTWSVAITRRCRQQMTWYRQCSLTYDTKAIRFSWFDIYLVGRIISVDWKRWEFAYVDKFGKVFFSQHFFPHFVNVSVQLFNS